MKKVKNTKFKLLLMLIAIIVSMFGSTLTVFADAGTVAKYLDVNAPNGTDRAAWTDSSLAGNFSTSTDNFGNEQTQAHTVGSITYYWKAADTEAITKKLTQSANDAKAVEDLSSITDNLGIVADYDTAGKMLSGFIPFISMVIGLMVILISIGMTLFTASDLCYIAFPIFRNKCEDAKQNGGILASGKKSANGDTKLRFVSDDAQYSVIAADTTQSGKNPFIIYFGKRIISYVILAILLFVLFTGRITIFTDIAVKVVSGILDVITAAAQ